MYDPEDVCDLPDETKLWRYMDLTKLVSLLDASGLFFPRADLLGDRWEGALPLPDQVAQNSLPPLLDDWQKESIRDHIARLAEDDRLRTFVSCWHQNEHESVAMWKLYVKSEAGIALQTTYERLRREFRRYNAHDIHPSAVEYIDYKKERLPRGDLAPYTRKRKSLEHEREFRAIVTIREGESRDYGLTIPVDPTSLIESIYTAPDTPKWQRDAVQSVVARFGLTVKVNPSIIDEDPAY